MNLADEEWRKKLTPEQYRVLREKGTESPFTGELLHENRDGVFTCVACGAKLFMSDKKYDSTTPGLTGWPSFSDVVKSDTVKLLDDNGLGMHRTEVQCANCGGHLGHLFYDGSAPNNQHYCINSCTLDFKPTDKNK